MITEDFFFYWFHRLAHCTHPWLPLYQKIHKVHHEFHVCIAVSAGYCHWLEGLVVNAAPIYIGLALCGYLTPMHYSTVKAYGFIRLYETMQAHSGYEFPWTPFGILPFQNDSTYHDYHHSHNVGNYAGMHSIWDTIFDTNTDYFA